MVRLCFGMELVLVMEERVMGLGEGKFSSGLGVDGDDGY